GPDPRNFNQRVSLGRHDLLIRTFPNSQGTRAGIEAAQRLQSRMVEFLAKRYPASKLTIEVFEPAQDIPDGKKGIDWNDVLQLTGQDGFPIHWAPECLNQL
ncbi:hypothetical protein ACV0OC_18005, partial [Enterobacter hormaechei]